MFEIFFSKIRIMALSSDHFHALGVGDEVGGEIAAVELHALDNLEGGVETLGLFNRDHAVFADLLHGLADDVADFRVGVGGDGADMGDGVALDGLGQRVDGLDGLGGGLVDAALELHGVGAGGDVLDALAVDGLGQHGGGGGAVAGDVGGLRGNLANHLRTHVLEAVRQLDLLGDGDAVLGDGRRAELFLEDHVAALGAEGHFDRVGELVDTGEELGASLLGVDDLFSSHDDSPYSTMARISSSRRMVCSTSLTLMS